MGRASAAYWSLLTIVDPLVAGLLLWRPRIGVPAAVILIATNVAHNVVLAAGQLPGTAALLLFLFSHHQTIGQIVFLAFVLATLPLARRDLPGGGRLR